MLSGNSPIQQRIQKSDTPSSSHQYKDVVTEVVTRKEKAHVLVVDDVSDNIDIIVNFLKDTYKLKVANNGAKAIKIVESGDPPDLILFENIE